MSGSSEQLTSSPGRAGAVLSSLQVSVKQRGGGPPAMQLKVVVRSIQGAELDLPLFCLFLPDLGMSGRLPFLLVKCELSHVRYL